jgi:hypothetical protein
MSLSCLSDECSPHTRCLLYIGCERVYWGEPPRGPRATWSFRHTPRSRGNFETDHCTLLKFGYIVTWFYIYIYNSSLCYSCFTMGRPLVKWPYHRMMLMKTVMGAVISETIPVMSLLLPTSSSPGRRTGAVPRLLGRNRTRLLLPGPKPRLCRYKLVEAVDIVVYGRGPSSCSREVQ